MGGHRDVGRKPDEGFYFKISGYEPFGLYASISASYKSLILFSRIIMYTHIRNSANSGIRTWISYKDVYLLCYLLCLALNKTNLTLLRFFANIRKMPGDSFTIQEKIRYTS